MLRGSNTGALDKMGQSCALCTCSETEPAQSMDICYQCYTQLHTYTKQSSPVFMISEDSYTTLIDRGLDRRDFVGILDVKSSNNRKHYRGFEKTCYEAYVKATHDTPTVQMSSNDLKTALR